MEWSLKGLGMWMRGKLDCWGAANGPGAVTCFPQRVKTVITHPFSKTSGFVCDKPWGTTFHRIPLLTKLRLAARRVWLESPSQTEPRGTWLGNCKLAFWLFSL